MLSNNKNHLLSEKEWDCNQKLEDGSYVCTMGGIPFHFSLKISNSKSLFVSLTGGAGGDSRINGPFFSRWSYYVDIDSTVLCVDDPMIWLYGLHHGWFYGTQEISFTKLLSELILLISQKLGIDTKDITFFCSSSGQVNLSQGHLLWRP